MAACCLLEGQEGAQCTGNTDPCPKQIRVRSDPINAWKEAILWGCVGEQ